MKLLKSILVMAGPTIGCLQDGNFAERPFPPSEPGFLCLTPIRESWKKSEKREYPGAPLLEKIKREYLPMMTTRA